jgi:pilus assembly protein CpaB
MARVGELAMAGGNRKLLLLALGAGLIAAIIVFAAVQSNSGSSSSSSSGPVTGAVVAARAIAAGSTIAAADVKVTDVPNSLLITGGYTDTSAAVGQSARVAIAQGEQITPDKIGSPAKSANGLNSVVPQGMRAIGIKVEQVTAVGGNLLPGDRVDVIVDLDTSAQTGISGSATVSTILQNIEILAIAQEAETPVAAPASGSADQTSTSGQLPSNAKSKPDASTVTLAVDPKQAELLAGVQQMPGTIYLTLRSFGDQATNAVPPLPVTAIGSQ